MEYLYFILGLIVSIVLLFIDYSYALGIVLALVALFILKVFREGFNRKIMTMDAFSGKLFLGYTLLVLVLMFIPLLLGFLYPLVINPYFVAGTIFFERIYMYISKIVFKDQEELNV